jgi:hypothetical protein
VGCDVCEGKSEWIRTAMPAFAPAGGFSFSGEDGGKGFNKPAPEL